MNPTYCNHKNKIGDNYGESCYDCGKQLSGYGYGGWFGRNITKQTCIHLWTPLGDNGAKFEICMYCEMEREKPVAHVNPDKGEL